MARVALYRKYRPKKFSEIVGQEHIIKTITNAIASNNVSHAYIFTGPRGSGKTTTARLLAKAVNCHKRKEGEFEPCNECSSCKEIMEGKSLDLIEIDAASHRGIEEIRELKEGIKFSPTKEKYKVFIIDEAHQLTKEASNALLKILEEPPSYAIFVLATTEIQNMIPTIVSRCQRFDFRKLKINEISKKLEDIAKKEKINIEKMALNLIALNAGGAVRDAESLLDQVFAFFQSKKTEKIKVEDVREILGLTNNLLVAKFVDFLIDRKASEAINFLNQIIEKGNDPQTFLKTLINYLRQILLLKIDSSLMDPLVINLTKEEEKNILSQAEKFELKEIQRAIKLFLEAENQIKYSPIPQLPIELAVVDFVKGLK